MINRSCSIKSLQDDNKQELSNKIDSVIHCLESQKLNNELLRLEISKIETETMRNSILLDASINENNSLRVKAYDAEIDSYNQKIKHLKYQLEKDKNGK